jgi:acetyl-CoA synthetase
MVWADYTFRNVFQVEENDVYWCTADIGWVTGHTYGLYGPLLAGGTSLMFEGVPTYPSPGRFWEVIDKHHVTIFYTAPTAIRSLMAAPLDHVLSYSLSSLRMLGSVGEPINEEAWHWYHQHVGKGRCPIVDTWWQTETGGIMISALGGITPSVKPAHAGLPLPGVQPVLLNQEGTEIEGNDQEGYLAIKGSWPGIIRTTWGDHERCPPNLLSALPRLLLHRRRRPARRARPVPHHRPGRRRHQRERPPLRHGRNRKRHQRKRPTWWKAPWWATRTT